MGRLGRQRAGRRISQDRRWRSAVQSGRRAAAATLGVTRRDRTNMRAVLARRRSHLCARAAHAIGRGLPAFLLIAGGVLMLLPLGSLVLDIAR
jgi:hypothetical protein